MINTIQKYEMMMPNRIMFSLKELEDIGVIKVSMLKKLLSKNLIEHIKVGSKNFITKDEILRFLSENTVTREDSKDEK